jgi:hypothetical protein
MLEIEEESVCDAFFWRDPFIRFAHSCPHQSLLKLAGSRSIFSFIIYDVLFGEPRSPIAAPGA